MAEKDLAGRLRGSSETLAGRAFGHALSLPAYHELHPHSRYTYQNFQTAGYLGTDINAPTGAGQMQFHDAGIAVFPSPQIVLKATYQKVLNRDPLGARSDSALGGVGFFF